MFKNLTIKSRLIFILSFLVAFLLGIQMFALFGMSSAIDGLKTVYQDRVIPLKQVGRIESLLLHNRVVFTATLLTPSPEVIEKNTAIIEKNIDEITRAWVAYTMTYLTPEENRLAANFADYHRAFIIEGMNPAVDALRANEIEEAHRILIEKIRPLYQPVDDSIRKLIALQLSETRQEYNQEQDRYWTIRNIFIASIIVVLVLVALFSFIILSAIFRPLEGVVKIARGVAAGNFSQDFEIRSSDEIGQLMRALKDMRDSLVETIGQVRASEAHTLALLSNMIDGVASIDEKGVIQTFNPAAKRIFGYAESEIIGQNVSVLFPAHEQGQGQSQHLDYFKSYPTVKKLKGLGIPSEVMGVRKDGTVFPMDLAVVEMHDGDQTMFVSIMRDISERKLAEEQKTRLMDELESANDELRSFAYVVSHDLKAPLRAIGALADWLSTDYAAKFDEEGREHMRLLVNRVHRMGNLIDGILEYSRVGRVKEDLVGVDVGQVVHEVIDLIAPPANVTISVENPLPTVVAEPTRIQQIFQNLLSNAIKYMDKPRGEIRIGCAAEGEQWKFSVSDNGPGIEPRHFDKIFQLFQTLAPRDRIESTGVGLALVKKIVEMYGGRIWLESIPGVGSIFYFTLPRTTVIANTTIGKET
ncbi:Tar ligand binding domain-containing protein [Nitrosovibrio tenuis]|uniref:histidine kinase n=1 Tax=Nitrosovibrio tenuis TaxID=1233 RepID=A0A1H7JC99_9PROT|nr:Tar ligand binding domain-containing protein [Nitrosovibrio tenuis]SEK71620.1 PAS domain S-box-containing protein [Nitrosovibrio tenuis]